MTAYHILWSRFRRDPLRVAFVGKIHLFRIIAIVLLEFNTQEPGQFWLPTNIEPYEKTIPQYFKHVSTNRCVTEFAIYFA